MDFIPLVNSFQLMMPSPFTRGLHSFTVQLNLSRV